MKSLNSLIRLHKRQIDVIASKISKAEDAKAALENKVTQIAEEVEREMQSCRDNSTYSYMLDKYLQNANKKKGDLESQIRLAESNIANLREQLFDQFAEMKKFELAKKHKELEILKKQMALEVKQLDEFNVTKIANNLATAK